MKIGKANLRIPCVLIILILVSFAYMLPVLIEAHWEVLDTGVILREAQALIGNWRHATFPGTDRYIPVLVLYYSVLLKLFGFNPYAFFGAQACVLAASVCLVFLIVKKVSESNKWGLLGGALYLTSSPVPENYYTLGKQEPRFVFFTLLAFYFYVILLKRRDSQGMISFRRWWALATGCFVFLLGSYFTKEVAFAVIPAFLTAAGIDWLRNRQSRLYLFALAYGGSHFLAIFLYLLGSRWIAGNPLPWEGAYASARLVTSSWTTAIGDYAVSGLDIIVFTIGSSLVLTVYLFHVPQTEAENDALVHCSAIAVAAAACYLLMLIFVWGQHLSYYLLPVTQWLAIGIPLLCCLTTGLQTRGILLRRLLACTIVLAALFSVPYSYNSARAHSIWNHVNGRAIAYLSRLPSGPHVFVNYPPRHEGLVQVSLLMRYLHRKERYELRSVYDQSFVKSCSVGDIIVWHYGGPGNRAVPARQMSQPLLEDARSQFVKTVPGLELEEDQNCQESARMISRFSPRPKDFVLGWIAYRIRSVPRTFLDTHADGWLGSRNQLVVRDICTPVFLVLEGRSFLPQSVSYPIQLEARSDGRLLGCLHVLNPGPFRFSFRLAPTTPEAVRLSLVDISANKTFNPKRDMGTNDNRDLSVIIEQVSIKEGD